MTTTKRIILRANQDDFAGLTQTASWLGVSKSAAIRLGLSLLNRVTDEMAQGRRVLIRDGERLVDANLLPIPVRQRRAKKETKV